MKCLLLLHILLLRSSQMYYDRIAPRWDGDNFSILGIEEERIEKQREGLLINAPLVHRWPEGKRRKRAAQRKNDLSLEDWPTRSSPEVTAISHPCLSAHYSSPPVIAGKA